jgi:hypothetical protein
MLSFTNDSDADVYRYEDEDGIVHFSDSPEDSRYKPYIVMDWFSISSSDDFACVPSEAPAQLISLCGSQLKCRIVEEVVKNGKPMVVKVFTKDTRWLYRTKYFFKTIDLCQKEAKRLKRENDTLETLKNKKLDKYR